MSTRDHRTYDHRLRELVWRTQDTSVVSELAIPRSTLDDWLRIAPTPAITLEGFDADAGELRADLARLRSRVAKLLALLRLLAALIFVSNIRVSMLRLPGGKDKKRVLRAVDRSRSSLSIATALRAIGLSAARFHAWRHVRENCTLDDRSSCPRFSPHRITLEEKQAIRSMVMGEDYRHVPTSTLAMLAQRTGRAYVSASTRLRLIRENGWRRPRARVHPAKPRQGIRAERPDQLWHVDTTVIRLLDGTRVYVHAVIDNFSRRILAWRATARFEVASTAIVLNEAAAGRRGEVAPTRLLTDAGAENLNDGVDALIESGLIRRVLAQIDVTFSNSMIEAWWRGLNQNWLYLHKLDSLAAVQRLVAFYVHEHNSTLPHSAFDGETPDEMYFGFGSEVSGRLETGRADARRKRREANRAARCEACAVIEEAA